MRLNYLVLFLYPEKFTFTLFWENCENTFFIPEGMNKFMSEEKKLHQCQGLKGRNLIKIKLSYSCRSWEKSTDAQIHL